MKFAFLCLVAFQGLLIDAQNCPNGFFYLNELNTCLFFQRTINGTAFVTNWMNANAFCRQQQSELVSIHNTIQNNILAQLQRNMTGSDAEFWLGASLSVNGTWTWTDGTPFDYQRFQFPIDVNGSIVLDSSDQMWKSRPNDLTVERNFFCETLTTPTPFPNTTQSPLTCKPVEQQPLYNCRKGWQYSPDTGYQYLVIFDSQVGQAESFCQEHGGHLASIHSKEENDFMTGLCCENGCEFRSHNANFFGLYLTGGLYTNGTRQWVDGTPFDYLALSCADDGEGARLIIFNYDLSCHHAACGQGVWGFSGSILNSDTVPYTVCKKK